MLLFILSVKQIANNGFLLDFGTFAGRAGRYKNELTGNIIV